MQSVNYTMSNQTSVCFEKERLSGVHFDERLLHECGSTGAAPMACEKPQMGAGGGTGVYFENNEVNTKSCCIHPLQAAENPTVHVMPAVACPAGQPLFAPPALATSIQVLEDVEMEDVSEESSDSGPLKGFMKQAHFPNASISLKDCTRSCIKGMAEKNGPHLFCETKRSAVRERLNSVDYRLSTDELTFVEAAVQLSKGLAHTNAIPVQPAKPARETLALIKPSLPCFVRFG